LRFFSRIFDLGSFFNENLLAISHERPREDDPNFFGNKPDIFFEEDEELPPHVIAGIQRGQADIGAGRIVTLEEFKKRMSSAK
jgi:hypothetical protein